VHVEWLPGALDDLAQINLQVTEFAGEAAGVRRVRKILASVDLLRSTPEIGRACNIPGVRELVIPNTPHIVEYHILETEVEIMGVRYGHQEFPSGGSSYLT